MFRPVAQNLTYFVTIITAGRELLSRQALSFVDLFAAQLTAQVEFVDALRRRG